MAVQPHLAFILFYKVLLDMLHLQFKLHIIIGV